MKEKSRKDILFKTRIKIENTLTKLNPIKILIHKQISYFIEN